MGNSEEHLGDHRLWLVDDISDNNMVPAGKAALRDADTLLLLKKL